MAKKVFKKTAGVALIVLGLVALFTPLTPGAWLVFIGLELLGVRLLLWERIKERFWRKPKEGA